MSTNQVSKPAIACPLDAPSLGDVVAFLSTSTKLSSTRKRDLRSAIRRFSDLLESTPERLPANIKQLKRLDNNIHPAQHGISAKTLQNIKSNLLTALSHFQGGSRELDLITP